MIVKLFDWIFSRSKKRGFFAISTVLSSSSDKKRNKGNRQENDIDKENKAEFKYFKENLCATINPNGDYQDFDGVTDDELEHGDTSDQSSSEVETAGNAEIYYESVWYQQIFCILIQF